MATVDKLTKNTFEYINGCMATCLFCIPNLLYWSFAWNHDHSIDYLSDDHIINQSPISLLVPIYIQHIPWLGIWERTMVIWFVNYILLVDVMVDDVFDIFGVAIWIGPNSIMQGHSTQDYIDHMIWSQRTNILKW